MKARHKHRGRVAQRRTSIDFNAAMTLQCRRSQASAAVIALVIVLLSVCQTIAKDRQRVTRNWKTAPAILELDQPKNLYAIGNVHGDFDRVVKLLAAAKLIEKEVDNPEDAKWAAGPAVLVCTGDLIDKGKHSLKVIAFFQQLQKDAPASGGRVILTMGNHEAEFLASGADDEKAETFLAELDKHGIDPEDVVQGSDKRGVGKFMASLPFAAKIGYWFFAHACNTDGRTLATLRTKLMDEVDAEGYGAPILSDADSLREARLRPIPWWEQPGDSAEESEARLRGYADALGIKHFVMGHQPGKAVFSDGTKRHKGESVQKFNGLIFLIDVGMSEVIDYSEGAILHIVENGAADTTFIIPPIGTAESIWNSN